MAENSAQLYLHHKYYIENIEDEGFKLLLHPTAHTPPSATGCCFGTKVGLGATRHRVGNCVSSLLGCHKRGEVRDVKFSPYCCCLCAEVLVRQIADDEQHIHT